MIERDEILNAIRATSERETIFDIVEGAIYQWASGGSVTQTQAVIEGLEKAGYEIRKVDDAQS